MQCLSALLLALLLAACKQGTHPPPATPGTTLPALQPPAAAPSIQPPSPPPDLYLAMPTVLNQLNAARVARGAQPLRIDRGLALVAQRASAHYQRVGAGLDRRAAKRLGLVDRVAGDAAGELAAFSLVFSSVRALIVCLDDLEQAADAMQAALDPAWHYAGLTVARSPGPDAGFAAVLMLGQ